MRAAIIGCGLIGRKRAAALPDCRLAVCCDTLADRAEALAGTAGRGRRLPTGRPPSPVPMWTSSSSRPRTICWRRSPRRGRGRQARAHRKAGRAPRRELDAGARPPPRGTGVRVRVGFNHRYHRAFRKAREIFESGALGEMMFMRGRYGHGGRLGYEQGVARRPGALRRRRADRPGRAPDRPRRAGSSAISPACSGRVAHLLLGHAGGRQRLPAAARRPRARWPSCTPAGPSGRTCSRSRSTAATASSRSTGLGGSYGVERLTCYRMLPEMGPPETTAWEYPDGRRFLGGRVRASSSTTSAWAASPCRGHRRRAGARCAIIEAGLSRGVRAMIITRSPLRISLGGGGTDLPSYYREHGGFLIAAAIDKYVYITLHETVQPTSSSSSIRKLEHVADGRRGQAPDHPRGAASWSASDARTWRSPAWPTSRPAPGSARPAASPRRCCRRCTPSTKNCVHPRELAEQACDIEIDRLGEPIGKQDQYIAAFGGITCFTFQPGRQRRGRAAADRHRDAATTWKTTCCCSSPASPARASAILAGPGRRAARQSDSGHDRQPALRQGARLRRARTRWRPATCAASPS